jgi:hypothetical protein
MPVEVRAQQMLDIGLNIIGYNEERVNNKSEESKNECLRRSYGALASVCSMIFRDINENKKSNNNV